jgi:hypothetical protein
MTMVSDRGAPATIARMDEIERLLAERRAAGISNKSIRIGRELRKLQDAELHHFARALKLRPFMLLGSQRSWSVLSLRSGPVWCESCGTTCGRHDAGHGQDFPHADGFHAEGGPRELSAVVVHSRWSLSHVEAYAATLRLSVRLGGWSWHGTGFLSYLITLGDGSHERH